MGTKRNVVLYLDKELVEKSKELGFNLSKTLENHLKHVMFQLSSLKGTQNSFLADDRVMLVGTHTGDACPCMHLQLSIKKLQVKEK